MRTKDTDFPDRGPVDKRPPGVKPPNAQTREAIGELEAGKGERSHSVGEMLAELTADD